MTLSFAATMRYKSSKWHFIQNIFKARFGDETAKHSDGVLEATYITGKNWWILLPHFFSHFKTLSCKSSERWVMQQLFSFINSCSLHRSPSTQKREWWNSSIVLSKKFLAILKWSDDDNFHFTTKYPSFQRTNVEIASSFPSLIQRVYKCLELSLL